MKAAATSAGFSAAAVVAGLHDPGLVVYRPFPRRNAPDVERVRTADDWPDDPPLAAR